MTHMPERIEKVLYVPTEPFIFSHVHCIHSNEFVVAQRQCLYGSDCMRAGTWQAVFVGEFSDGMS